MIQRRDDNTSLRSIWTGQEDALLSQLALAYKGKKWNLVAQAVSSQGRQKTAKQCRERWHTRLNPAISMTAWSKEEETKLLDLHKALGSKWSEIAEKLPGRTDNAVKNWFFCRLRKLLRSVKNSSLDLDTVETESIEQLAYLLNYLYSYYISPEHKKNMQKIIHSRIIGRANQGDKYLRNMISNDTSISYCFQRYLKYFLLNLPTQTIQVLLSEYPQLFPTEGSDSITKDLSEVQPSNLLDIPIFSNPLK